MRANFIKIFICTILFNISFGQYYRPPPLPQLDNYNSAATNNDNLNEYEQKYVNGGQSVVLICDLPNSMPDGKVLFVKYDNKALSSGWDIREDSDDERFEIGQQYAWEWSLKINSISEDDTGIYVCKVGETIIKQFEIIVRVPPRIKDDSLQMQNKNIREGSSVQFSCFASGTPKPNITWFVFDQNDQSLKQLPQFGNYLKIDNVTRYTPRRYQCRASNNIPPSDTRNLTFNVDFAPEIEINSRVNTNANIVQLNCTINAYPLTNRNFWRKDGKFVYEDGVKTEIKNIRLNDFTLVSQLTIKYYEEADQGLYECTGENDLRVSKIIYNLKYGNEIQHKEFDLVPIGSNSVKDNQRFMQPFENSNYKNILPSTIQPPFTTFKLTTKTKRPSNIHHTKKSKNYQFDNDDMASLNNIEINNVSKNQRKHQRNHRNQTKSFIIEKLIQTTTSSTTNHNSPYIILIDEDNNVNSDRLDSTYNDEALNTNKNNNDSNDDKLDNSKHLLLNDMSKLTENSSSRLFNEFLLFKFSLIVTILIFVN